MIMCLVQFDVLAAEGTATDSVCCLVHVLLVTCSESEFIDEVEGDGPLSDPHLLALEVLGVHVSDVPHHILEPPRSLVLLVILLYLDLGGGIEHDIFVLAENILIPRYEPCHSVIVSYFLPLVTTRRRGNLA
ncbi:hypothetical protein PMAYCL1PPCAC_23723, partial [Pristionchus mayeri]